MIPTAAVAVAAVQDNTQIVTTTTTTIVTIITIVLYNVTCNMLIIRIQYNRGYLQ